MRPQRVNINYNAVVVVIINRPPLPKYENSKGIEMVPVMWAIVYRPIVFILLGCDLMFSC